MRGMLFQDNGTIENALKNGIQYFIKKYSTNPDMIHVNPETSIKVYDGIPLRKDVQMYSKTIILMIIPEGIKLNGE